MSKVLWAPWRMEFISSARGKNRGGCILCDLPRKGISAKTLVLHRDETFFIILNRYPYTNGHLMVVPRRHVGDFSALTEYEHEALGMGIAWSVRILKKVLKAQGFNIGMNLGKVAGAGIDRHVHYHVVPRWEGDTNFVPVLSHVRVMPEYIKETYRRLAPHFH